jgi:hypothetical protein
MPETNGPVLNIPFKHFNDGTSQVPVVRIEGLDLDGAALSVVMTDGVDSLGDALPAGFSSYPQVLGYTSGNLTTITVTVGADEYVQTLSYTDGNLTGVSAWVKQ